MGAEGPSFCEVGAEAMRRPAGRFLAAGMDVGVGVGVCCGQEKDAGVGLPIHILEKYAYLFHPPAQLWRFGGQLR